MRTLFIGAVTFSTHASRELVAMQADVVGVFALKALNLILTMKI
jgi:hypothetical protein